MRRDRSGRPRRGGFTLVETVVAMMITFVLLGGVASALILASRAVPAADSVFSNAAASTDVLQLMTGELLTATSFSERTARTMKFRVHDRSDDTIPETIRYSWNGVPGSPLLRHYGQTPAVAILDDVHAFDLTYLLEPIEDEDPAGAYESEETLLIGYDAVSLLSDFPVTSTTSIGQYFLPSLPADATSWSVTRVKFLALADDTLDGVVKVQVRKAGSDKLPTGELLDGQSLDEADFSADFWQEVSFTEVTGVSVSQGLGLTIIYESGASPVGKIRYRNASANVANAARLEYNSGAWAAYSDQAMLFEVYGTVTGSSDGDGPGGAPSVSKVYHVEKVGVAIQVGSDPAARVETGVPILNRPEVVGP